MTMHNEPGQSNTDPTALISQEIAFHNPVLMRAEAAPAFTEKRAIDLDKSAMIIASLRSRFVQVVETMSDDLWGALETINNNPRHSITQIHHIAHSLAGNAETFGFPVLGRAAYDLSEVIQVQEGFANDNIDVREIAALSNHLLEMLRDVAATVTH